MPDADYTLYYVTGPVPEGVDFFESLEKACQGGVTMVQIREKTASTREFLTIAQKAKAITDKYSIPLLINDRLDIALAVGCGLHVGQDDFPAILARKLIGPDQLLGVSVNTAEELHEVLKDNVADYVGIGPVHATASKKDHNPKIGVRGVRDILELLGESSIKTVAIGGLNEDTVPNLVAQSPAYIKSTGQYRKLDGIACISAISHHEDPKKSAQILSSMLRSGPSIIRPPGQLRNAPSSESLLQDMSALFSQLRATEPAVCHNITNQVVMNDTANLTLAFSSSPIMSGSPEEMADLGKIIGALVLNMGTLNERQVQAATIAGQTANKLRKPVILDPVGVGASQYRKGTMSQLMDDIHMTVIKGNAGEIGAISGLSEVQTRGVDSAGGTFKDPAAVVRELARREKTIVAMSGKIDYVSDGWTVVAIENGHEYQGEITGSGCMCSASIACHMTAMKGQENAFVATVAGIVSYNIAAELAGKRQDVKGPNTFRAALIDECYNLKVEDIQQHARIRIL
ncbi:thiamine biosynthetic bifunctional enzyme Thi4 [Cystobasidium minutum MCA 4210]|uniref:thiamine biosynthetic bifunctional enzyme Thi4 n=1 Tax=Cystobasidium minutum MCA 4210 TaxID=1397322 RepID=UPI0034CD5B12|eukprot:jgi/Rhomi1/65049/CE65048_2593